MRLRPQFRPQPAPEGLAPPAMARWVNERMRDITNSIPILKGDLYPTLTAEKPFHVVDESYPYGWLRRFGVVPGSLAAQDDKITNCINAVNALQSGLVYADGGLGDVYCAQTGWYTIGAWRGIRFKDVANIAFWQAPGCVFKALDSSASNHSTLLGIMDSTNIHVWNFKGVGERLIHTGPVGEDGHVLALVPRLVGNQDIYLYYPDCSYGNGDGIFVGIDDSQNYNLQQWNRRTVIVSPKCQYNQRQGISAVCGVDGEIYGGDLSHNTGTAPGGGFDAEPQIDSFGHYAPVTGWKLFGPRATYNWRGFIVTGGAEVEITDPHGDNNSLYDYELDGTRGTRVTLNGYSFFHDEAVAPSPLPTGVHLANGSSFTLRGGKGGGRVLYALNAQGSGSSHGKHTIAGLDLDLDANCETAVLINNTANEIELTEASVRGAQRSLVATGSNKLRLQMSSYDAVGASNPNLADMQVEGNDLVLDLTSTRAAYVGAQIASANRVSGTVRSTLAGRDGVNLYAVLNSPDLAVVSSGNGTLSPNGYYDLVVTGNSTDNHPKAALRYIAGGCTTGLRVYLGSARNDFRGSDMRGYPTADYQFDDPTTIYEREPGTTTRGNTNVTLTAYSTPTQRITSALTVDRTWRINPASMFNGFRISGLRSAAGAGAWIVGVPVVGSSVTVNNGSLRYVPYSGQTGQYGSATPLVAIPTGTGTIVITALLTNNAWTTSTAQQYIAAQDDGASQRGWGFLKSATGLLSFYWSTNGTSVAYTLANNIAVPGAVDGSPIWVRVTIANSGADVTSTFATAAFVPGSVAVPGLFTNYGTGQTALTTSVASMFHSSDPLEVAGVVSGGVQIWDGDIYRVLVTVGGSTSVDFNPQTDATDGVSSWTRGGGETWTLHGVSGATTPVATLAGKGRLDVAADDTGALYLAGYEVWP